MVYFRLRFPPNNYIQVKFAGKEGYILRLVECLNAVKQETN